MSAPDSQAANPVRTVAKITALLDHLAERGEASASELARALNEPRSNIYRLLVGLTAEGLVETGPTRGSYRLGVRLFRLGSRVAERFDERQLALPVMNRIHAETGETLFLCVRRGDDAVCIERIDGRHVQSLALLLGGSLPLHTGAAPLILLAYATEDEQADYLRRFQPARLTPTTLATPQQIASTLAEVRARGFAVSDQDVTVGIAAIGAPVFDHNGRIRAALSISGLQSTICGDQFGPLTSLIVEGAKAISASMGYVS